MPSFDLLGLGLALHRWSSYANFTSVTRVPFYVKLELIAKQ